MTTSSSSAEPSTPYPILVVDDDHPVYDLLSKIAKNEFTQARFIHTKNSTDTISYLEQATGWSPRLIILDMDLKGGQSGLDLLSWIRANKTYSVVPVVILSMIHDEAVVREAYARGANLFTNKPFSLEEWKDYVRFLRHHWFERAITPKLWLDQPLPIHPV